MRVLLTSLALLACCTSAAHAADQWSADYDYETNNWTGAYLAVEAGGAYLNDLDLRLPAAFQNSWGIGAVAGVSLGYLYQINQFVVGAEVGYRYQPIKFQGLDAILPYEIFTRNQASARLRAGIAHGPWLVSANVGGTWGDSNIGLSGFGVIGGVEVDYLLQNGFYAGLAYDHQYYHEFAGAPLYVHADSVMLKLGKLF